MVAVLAVLGVIAGRQLLRERVLQRTVTIVSIDPESRTATIEYVQPKTGRALQIEGYVAPECDIRIDGEPATMRDLRIGEQAEVQATVRGTNIRANWVHVTRGDALPATQPSSAASPDSP